MVKKVALTGALLVFLASLFVVACSPSPVEQTTLASIAKATSAAPTTTSAKTITTPAAPTSAVPATTPAAKPTTTAASSYSVPCKVITAADIASVLGVAADGVTEQPAQPSDTGCIQSFIAKLGATPAPVTVALTDTKASQIYGAEPKLCLANSKNMVAKDKPSLGIGDYDSFEMVGGAIMFGKGKYMIQVTCPMGISIDKTIAIAKLVAQHM